MYFYHCCLHITIYEVLNTYSIIYLKLSFFLCQNAQLLKENAELRLKADSRLDEEIIQRAIKDRDDAISKYVIERKTAFQQEKFTRKA